MPVSRGSRAPLRLSTIVLALTQVFDVSKREPHCQWSCDLLRAGSNDLMIFYKSTHFKFSRSSSQVVPTLRPFQQTSKQSQSQWMTVRPPLFFLLFIYWYLSYFYYYRYGNHSTTTMITTVMTTTNATTISTRPLPHISTCPPTLAMSTSNDNANGNEDQ